ncbi:MAG: hypothetical protein Q4D06_07525 [Coriobacteriia bacterium]|nr:hypothetical protein [Coriobacteriia bacterium]
MQSYLSYSSFLEEAAEAFEISVCGWNPAGRTPETMFPGLADAVGPEREWRALIACDMTVGYGKNQGSPVVPNPFDLYEGEIDADGSFVLCEECRLHPAPAVLASRILGGIPKGERSRSVAFGQTEEMPSDGMVRFHVPFARPQELIFISPRNVDEDVYMVDRTASALRSESGLSAIRGFSEESGYSDAARFVVIDRPLPPSLSYDHDVLAFWLACMTLARYDRNRSPLRHGQLYRCDFAFDEEQLVGLLAQHLAGYEMAKAKVAERLAELVAMRTPVEGEDQDLPPYKCTIPVDLNFAKAESIYLDKSQFGLLKDQPVLDETEFSGQYRGLMSSISAMVLAPRRAMSRVVTEFRTTSVPTEQELAQCNLTRLSQDILAEELRQLEERLAVAQAPVEVEERAIRNRFKESKKNVEEAMKGRLTALNAAAGVGGSMMVVFLGFLPSVLGFTGSMVISPYAALATLLTVVAVGAMGVAFLRKDRHDFEVVLDSFNATAQTIANDIRARLQVTSTRMGDYASYRNGRMYLDAQKHKNPPVGREEEELVYYHALINREEERFSLGQSELSARVQDELRRKPFVSWNAVRRSLEDGSIYRFGIHSFTAHCPYNESVGEKIQTKVPYEFVQSVDVVPIDPVGLKGGK